MSDWSQKDVDDAVNALMEKVTIDEDFRAKALSNPNEAIKELTGKDLPDGYRVKLLEPEPGFDNTFILPPLQNRDLTDDELDAVAGGGGNKGQSNKHNIAPPNPNFG